MDKSKKIELLNKTEAKIQKLNGALSSINELLEDYQGNFAVTDKLHESASALSLAIDEAGNEYKKIPEDTVEECYGDLWFMGE